ncbi:hypothetical protein ACIFQM_00410 [Paenibacillus sp. NRS-1782]|uniref:hypothetical protein n=1 Tax=unclassified Paenibacillus TaxID=185978 RepID=UPI003D2DF9A6
MTTQGHSNNNGMLSYDETTFRGLLKIVKLEPLKNWSSFWAVVLTLLMIAYVLFEKDFEKLSVVADKTATTLLSASAAIFGIVIASLTLTITLFHQKLLPVMLKHNLLHRYLFPFWFVVLLWSINIVMCLFIVFIQVFGSPFGIAAVFSLEIFLFLFATFYTVNLTGLVIQLALQRAQIET